MSRAGWTVVVATAALLVNAGRAQEVDSAEALAAEVDRLVIQLDDAQLRLRKEAEAKLLGLGPEALPFLPDADDIVGVSARSTLARVRLALEVQAAQQDLQPSFVTIQEESIRLSEAIDRITEQTGNPMVDLRRKLGQPAPDPELNVHFDKTPFWSAVDTLCRQAGLDLQPYSGNRQVGLIATPNRGEGDATRVSYSGPFRVAARRWEITGDLVEPVSRSYRLRLQVMWEPRLRPLFLSLPMSRLSGWDDLGHRLTAAHPEAQYEANVKPGGIASEMVLDLVPPERRTQRIVELTGAFVATTATRIETFRLEPIQQAVGTSIQQGPIELRLHDFRRNGQLWEAFLSLQYDLDLPAFDSHRSWVFSNEIYLEEADGTRIEAITGSNADFPTPGTVELSYQFSRAPKQLDDYRLVYGVPSMVVPVEIEFELHDLPLP